MLIVDDRAFLVEFHLLFAPKAKSKLTFKTVMKNMTCGDTYDDVLHENEAAYDKRLADFQAVEAGVNVDTVSAEDSEEEHIHIVHEVEVDEVAPD